jgi:hypothetical protein
MESEILRILFPVVWALLGWLCTACSSLPALHVVGVHEGTLPEPVNAEEDGASSPRLSLAVAGAASDTGLSRPREEAKEVTVNVTETGRPMVLALMAYNRTLWKVALKPGVRLNKVILGGYHRQQVTGIPAGMPGGRGMEAREPHPGGSGKSRLQTLGK